MMVMVVVVELPRVRETSQPEEREPGAKEHVILTVPFPYSSTDTDWSPEVTAWNRH